MVITRDVMKYHDRILNITIFLVQVKGLALWYQEKNAPYKLQHINMGLRTKHQTQKFEIWYSQATMSLNGQPRNNPAPCCDWLSLMTVEEKKAKNHPAVH